ncbi:MATE family efflux transporter [Cyberlindnera jadinii NRRL Y-1542]|uniref:MATE efflux family protein n=2 Tax=Cyberlindnera jadinii (strain ATCC 18201 / CBS 1600 / BCRC 20928 / JCM 3617 / NBRC 0987 / NRRL Y-1542) TaxID=983966 RepID=A0A1E4SA56_CYBJN|nr:MATE efflux family protein [Cyberlindnera jadinii NRRL Y-1542]ODV76400.1 MATE efflux family protein [Cyberlindnera jadinii NRRL Y-1542]
MRASTARRSSSSSIKFSAINQPLLPDNGGYYGSIRSKKKVRRPFLSAITDEDNVDDEDRLDLEGYDASVDTTWEEPEVSVTTEVQEIAKASLPLSVTFFFEYLLAMNSLFFIGHLGSAELASASLAVMTFNITGMAMFEGMSSCLDTFCSQAYGAKKFFKVGIYAQRCTVMIMTLSIPVLLCWWHSGYLLSFIVPERELLQYTQDYMRILCAGAPGLIIFETTKRYLQAQEIFHASTYVLFFCLPMNLFLNYFLINNIGFIGAPIAVIVTYWFMASFLILYIIFVDGMACWNGFTIRAFKHWKRMLHLAVPGFVMIESEYLSFEILTVMASYFGTESLAAQSIISNVGSLTYQLPFAVGCAISTRVAIYIGSGSMSSSKVSVRISFFVAAAVGLFTCMVIIIFRGPLTRLFSSDEEVIEKSIQNMPILAVNQLTDTFNIIAAAVLRAQGRQKGGSILNVISYYVIALPLSYILAFRYGFEISGLWIGLGVGITVLAIGEVLMVVHSKWPQIIRAAQDTQEEEELIIEDDSSTACSSLRSFEEE